MHGKYYDLEPFLELYPGGRRLLHQVRVTNCTAVFESTHLHDRIPKKLLERYYVTDKTGYSPSF
ncbi:MAG: hypothetical protein DSY87_03190 [Methylococcus sp.]|nr:MAG: hypothetical protein DSY87_03190 [Methylococcus sp.]